MGNKVKLTLLSILMVCARNAHAGFDFSELTNSDVENVSKDFTALLSHTAVSPAVGLLKEGGYEFGLILGTVSVPNISAIATEENPDEEAQYRMYNFGLTGAYAYTRRLTFEFKLLPDLKFGDVTLGSQSVGMKLSLRDKDEVATSAFRVFLTNSYIRAEEILNNASTGNQDVNVDVKFSSLSTGLTYLYGIRTIFLKAMYFNPYVGAGFIATNSKLQVKGRGNASIFDSQSKEETTSPSGVMYIVGVETNYLFTKCGFEYSRVFDSDKVTFKIAFGY